MNSFVCDIHGLLHEDECYIYGKNIRCKQCLQKKNHDRYLANKSAIIARVAAYNKSHPEKGARHREKHKEAIRQRQRSWYEENSKTIREKASNWVKNNAEKAKESRKRYRNEHKTELKAKHEIWREKNLQHVQTVNKAYAARIRLEAVKHYSNGTMQCALCGDPHFNHLCLDHVEGGGTQHRLKDPGTRGKAVYAWCKRNDYPPIFRVLCWNCNFLVIPRAEPTSSKQIRYMRRLKEKVLSHYAGGEPTCSKCGNQDIRVLTIDHVNKGGRKHLAGLKIKGGTTFYRWLQSSEFPAGYRVLCFNCNCGDTV